jgi:hypothetical protein
VSRKSFCEGNFLEAGDNSASSIARANQYYSQEKSASFGRGPGFFWEMILNRFHTQNKLLYLSYGQIMAKRLGQIIANREGRVPIAVPKTLLRGWILRNATPALAEQTWFAPWPDSLMLLDPDDIERGRGMWGEEIS